MRITYCSNDSSRVYGDKVFAVGAGLLPCEDMTDIEARYTHVVAQEVDETSIFGCPSSLVIDISDTVPLVRPKGDAELAADAQLVRRNSIFAQIAELEALQTPRRYRDAHSANPDVASAGRAWFDALEARIAALRESV